MPAAFAIFATISDERRHYVLAFFMMPTPLSPATLLLCLPPSPRIMPPPHAVCFQPAVITRVLLAPATESVRHIFFSEEMTRCRRRVFRSRTTPPHADPRI